MGCCKLSVVGFVLTNLRRLASCALHARLLLFTGKLSLLESYFKAHCEALQPAVGNANSPAAGAGEKLLADGRNCAGEKETFAAFRCHICTVTVQRFSRLLPDLHALVAGGACLTTGACSSSRRQRKLAFHMNHALQHLLTGILSVWHRQCTFQLSAA